MQNNEPSVELRDYFAANALAIFARDDFRLFTNCGEDINDTVLAINCYKIADAMLSVRGWGHGTTDDA